MKKNRPLVMSPGPSMVSEDVRRAMSEYTTDSNLDPAFLGFYDDTRKKLARLLNTQNDVVILSGEGMIGLEAACASLIEPGDRVLCISNGIFGKGFVELCQMYGAEVTCLESGFKAPISPDDLEEFLRDKQFKLATVVHCETPSGLLNPVDLICPILHSHGILTVVDSVSAIAAERVMVDEWNIDICLGASQKCLSAPTGLAFLSISPEAWQAMDSRKKPIIGFYANLTHWKDLSKYTPYTFPENDLLALHAAVERVLARGEEVYCTHAKISEAVRRAVISAGLSLFPESGWSASVTAIENPEGVPFADIFEAMLNEHNIIIAGAFDVLDGKVIRIGHMGENCREEYVYITLKALDSVLRKLNVQLKEKLHLEFARFME